MRLAPRTTLLALTPLAAVAMALPAAAAPPTHGPTVVVDGLVTPLSFDVSPRGDVVVGEAFAGLLTHVTKHGRRDVLASVGPHSVGAVSVSGRTVTWAERGADDVAVTSSVLHRLAADGTSTSVDILAYETAENPDAVNTYGIQGLDAACAATIPAEMASFLLPYTGGPDSNPYGSVTVGDVTYVADAGANAVLTVSAGGEVGTLAVLPPTAILLTADMVAGQGLDPCVAGHEFRAEPVPTDVEVGTDGMLYVSSLPGGAEDDSLGANGAVHRIDPRTGAVDLLARGFLGATNLAVAPDGTVYVTELFAGELSAITRRGDVVVVAELDSPAAVEWQKGRLYVSTQVFGDGAIVAIMPRR